MVNIIIRQPQTADDFAKAPERIWSEIMFKHEVTEPDYASVSPRAFDQISPRTHLLLLSLLTMLIYIGSAWRPALQDDDDASHARTARGIVERNDWLTLHINGIRNLENTPLLSWTLALPYSIFRLP